MKSLLNLKNFLIVVAFAFRNEAQGGILSLSDECPGKVTCQACVNFECFWVTVSDGTLLCVGNLARWGGRFIMAFQKEDDCKPSQVSENINHFGSQVIYYNGSDSSNTHSTPNNLAKRAESIMIQTQTQMNLTKSFLYKQKTLLSLKFLHSIIPRIQILEQNMTALVYKRNDENGSSSSNDTENYKLADKNLDSELLAIEKDVNQNRKHLTEYMDAYQNIEGEMKFLNDTMQRGFGGSN